MKKYIHVNQHVIRSKKNNENEPVIGKILTVMKSLSTDHQIWWQDKDTYLVGTCCYSVFMRLVYVDGKLKLSLIEEEMKAIKKTWPQPIEIDERWIPFLVEDIANVNLQAWKDKLEKSEYYRTLYLHHQK